ncbi:MAG: hypothetical protein ACK58T_26610, partial [Phycisphaerae bacterium]
MKVALHIVEKPQVAIGNGLELQHGHAAHFEEQSLRLMSRSSRDSEITGTSWTRPKPKCRKRFCYRRPTEKSGSLVSSRATNPP